MFRNRRIDLLEVKGGRELNAFGGNALIWQAVSSQVIDNEMFI